MISKDKFLKWFAGITVGFALIGALFWILVFYRIYSDPSNHTSFNISSCASDFYILLAMSGFLVLVRRKAAYVFIGVFAIASVYGIHAIDQRNYLVQYETWLKRGMPQKGMPNRRNTAVLAK